MKKIIMLVMVAGTLLFLGFAGGHYLGEQQKNPVLAAVSPSIPAGTLAADPEKISTETEFRLNLNTATMQELEMLPGVGPAIAQRILNYREQHGGFRTVSELIGVSGIGEKTLEKLEPYLYLQ